MNDYNSYLRPVTIADLQLIYKWRNESEIRKLMFNDNVIEWEAHTKWFESINSDKNNDIKIFMEDSKPRGIVQVNKINILHQTAEWGFYIGDRYKKGLGTLLAYHALNYIFHKLVIRKLSAQVLSINEKSIRYHQKIGFEQEGILQQQIYRDEKFIDVFLFAQFKQNWDRNRATLMEGYKYA